MNGNRVDLVVFASSTMIENFIKIVGSVPKTPVACIGPITAKTARAFGFDVVVVAKKATLESLIHGILDFICDHK